MNQIKKYLCLALLLSVGMVQSATTNNSSSCSSSCSTSCSTSGGTNTIFVPIAQGSNLYTQYHKNAVMYDENYDERDWHLDASVTYRFQQSRNGCDIANALFNTNGGSLLFQGSNYGMPGTNFTTPPTLNPGFVAASAGPRAANALIADYFGMGPNTNISVALNPKITNNIIDVQLGAGMDCLCDGLYFQINLPIVNSKWSLNACGQTGSVDTTNVEGVIAGTHTVTGASGSAGDLSGANTLQQVIGLFAANGGLINDALPANPTTASCIEVPYSGVLTVTTGTGTAPVTTAGITQVVAGNIITQTAVGAAPSLQAALNGYTFDGLATRSYNLLNIGNVATTGTNCSTNCSTSNNGCSNSKWGLDGVYLQLGYDFWRCDTYHLGIYAKAIIPTGTKINAAHAKYAFSPIVGNAHHFELGGGISAGAELWCNDCNDSTFVANFDGYVTHMFSNTQFRTFDVTNAAGTILPMSRYMLLKQLTQAPAATPAQITALGACPASAIDPFASAGVLVSAGDVNAQNVCISVAARGEAVIDLIYRHCDWEVGGGYSFSGQSSEQFSSSSCTSSCSTSCSTATTTPATTGFLYGFAGVTGASDIIFTTSAANTTVTPNIVAGGVTAAAIKTNSDIDTGATAYTFTPTSLLGTSTSQANQAALTADNLFTLPEPNCSGLMGSQVLNRLFGHVDYVWSDSCWMPTLGVLGSIGFSTSSNVTAEYWDVGARFGFSY